MKDLYYPGCSLKGTGKHYEESLLKVFKAAGLPLEELQDWNCCGATAYMSVDELDAFALASRNLALAEKTEGGPVNLVAPCNACYLVLLKAQKQLRQGGHIGRAVAGGLEEVGMQFHDQVVVRHPLDVLVNDVGIEKLKASIVTPLDGLKIACYYGCQVVRPIAEFDNQHNPMTMDTLLRAMGAETVDWSLKARCCGGTLTGTIENVGKRLSYILLHEAQRLGVDVVATACPLCQFNLECYQNKMHDEWGDKVNLPVVYFSQIMGLALGYTERQVGLHRLICPALSLPVEV